MHKLRRLFAWTRRDDSSRMPTSRLVALVLIVVLPGGLFVPIFCGLYGALRHSLAGKVAARGVDSGAPVAVTEDAPLR